MRIFGLFCLFLFFTAKIHAQGSFPTNWATYRCDQIKPPYGPANLTLNLSPKGPSTAFGEERPPAYRLEVLKNRQLWISENVAVNRADALLAFEAKSKNIQGRISLDELDQTSLIVKGRRYAFDCRSPEDRF